ncbi:WD40-repeat-containing domain [Pseudocohnilembus persalinus]|uniref:WD40-repeat-containing domain n=1 Tax=Pseudocohnilembus persalinus TaxID=266149 RepID=A0A0V0QH31_PSEPJ|nr:WD40-repeat-containing domain [Pseudocohnilembus persalinus]|eukprot:KRX01519.1 WD40-repeat-containing domain [Pseudocohnilembus persalinus]
MQQLIKSKQVQYNFSIRTSCKIKIFDHHPNKPWICYSTSNNVIQVWDYNQKTCIKTFNEVELENNNQNFSSNQSYDGNNNTIDLQKNFDLKSIKFFDKNVLFWLFPNCNQKSQEEEEIINNFKRNWIIFQGDQKVIFYDYVTDKAKVISFAEFEYKNIKCFEIIDHQYLTFACTDGSIKIFDIINWTFAKSMKWNQRSISKMISHKQNEGNRPRLIVSASDGSLACWNVDTNTDVPAFKFLMTKKGKQLLNANDGQDILCMCLDPYNHKLITVTEDYITVWSALAGTEIQRFKNSKGSSIKEIHLLNHHTFNVKFTSNLTVDQTKDFVRSNGEHKFISPELKEKLKIYEQQQSSIINFLYLSVQNQELYCNLFDSSKEESLHFLSEAKKVYDGVGVQIVWHQYLDEFAVLCPLDNKNQFLKIFERKETISTGSFFSKKSFSKYTVDLSEKISKMTLCVYSFEENGENNFEQPKVILINDRFLNPTQLFGNGENYCVVDLTLDPDIKEMLKNPSARKQEAFRMHKFNKGEFFDVDREYKTYKKIGGSIIAPLNVFWSQSNQICICSYSNFFSLFKFDKEQNQMQLQKVHNYTILDGYFWENLFFFITENSVNLLVTDFIKDDIILELATIEIKLKKEFIFDFNEIFGGKEEDIIYDNIYPEQQKKPPGQSKILTIYDFKLVLINQNNELGFIYLEHPFIKFCMYLQHQKYDNCLQITNQFDPTPLVENWMDIITMHLQLINQAEH